MNRKEALKEFRRIVKEELPKVKVKLSNKKVGAGLLWIKASKEDETLSRVLSKRLAELSEIIGM